MPKISIIVPVYNVEKYLERCLDSLVNQTLNDIEILLVDDGSTDNSLKICEKYASDSRIKIIKQANAGQSAARNNALKVATGDYIGFVDSDDWVDTDFYEKLYNAAIQKNADIAMADFVRKGEKKHKIRLNLEISGTYNTTEEKFKIANALKEGCIWNKIYRKEILSDLRFVEGMYYEDGLFTLKALHNSGTLVTVVGTYYYYFQNPKSTVKSPDKKKMADKIKARQQMMTFIREKNIQIKDKSFWAVKKSVEIFGKTLYSIKESSKTNRLCLFGLIPIAEWRCRNV